MCIGHASREYKNRYAAAIEILAGERASERFCRHTVSVAYCTGRGVGVDAPPPCETHTVYLYDFSTGRGGWI